jgi:hypothetical protein
MKNKEDSGKRQKEKGRSYLSAHQPNFFILPFAFLPLPSEQLAY